VARRAGLPSSRGPARIDMTTTMPRIGWPAHWSRERRAQASIVVAAIALVVALWAAASLIALAPEPIGSNAQLFADGTVMTVKLTVVAGLVGLVLGLLAGLGKVSRIPPVRAACTFYIWIFRGTPLLVQIFFVYFALPRLAESTGSEWLTEASRMTEFTAAVLALSLNVGAYNAEAFRAGLLAVPKGQFEAARSIGLGRWHTLVDVTFPQAFKVALPPLVSNVVALLKDTSLAYNIGVLELVNAGQRVQSRTFDPVPILITTALLYLVMTTLLTKITNGIERFYDYEGRLP
jgi:polar amino acid transport system permease protein